MTQYHRVEGHDDLYKNVETGVIINRSSTDREKYLIAKKQAMMNLNSQQEIEGLKNEVSEIKQLLLQLISNQSKS